MRAQDVMTRLVVTVTPETTVKYAASLLASHGYTALPVVDDDDRLIGIVTEADLVRDRFPRDARSRRGDDEDQVPPGSNVADVMSTPAIGMSARTDVTELVTAMQDGKIRSMPIVDGARLAGIVTRRDLVRVISRDDSAIATDLRRKLANYGGPDRWRVDVSDGVVELGDEYDDATEQHVAIVLAESVPGVVAVHVVAVRR
jgi:CBS-domain-containing membrane protein